MISIKNINIQYDRSLIEHGDLTLEYGKITILSGPSGSGKTSLLTMVGLLSDLGDCKYHFDDILINQLDETHKANYRMENISFVFQENNLFNQYTAYENISFAARMSGYSIKHEEIRELLEMVQMWEYRDQCIEQLSGGQKQRIAIACALSKQSKLLLLDEPTSFLDFKNCEIVKDILVKIANTHTTMILIATHDERIKEIGKMVYSIQDSKLKVLKDEPDDAEISNFHRDTIQRTKKEQRAAIQQYVKKRNKKSGVMVTLVLSFVISVFLFNDGYSKAYKEAIKTNVFDSGLEELRVYYGKNELKTYQGISKLITTDNIKKINRIEGIEKIVPFYQSRLIINNKEVLIQTYEDEKNLLIVDNINDYPRLFVNDKSIDEIAIYASATFIKNNKGYKESQMGIVDENLTFTFDIAGTLDKSFVNRYSTDGEEILYVPIQFYLDELNREGYNPSMYIINVTEDCDISKIKDEIAIIDKEITFFTPLGIDNIMQFNKGLMETSMSISKTLFVCLLFMLIYDKLKAVKQRHAEIALLKANGMSYKYFSYMFLHDQRLEVIVTTVVSSLISVLALTYFDMISIAIVKSMLFYLCFFELIILFLPLIMCLLLSGKYEVHDLLKKV